tara:strand:- start:22 stop:201 length:180 start_codon:yes stop_codon:yes gene_type:complete
MFFICFGYFGAISFSNNDYIENPLFCGTFSLLVFSNRVFIGFISHKFSKYSEKEIYHKI